MDNDYYGPSELPTITSEPIGEVQPVEEVPLPKTEKTKPQEPLVIQEAERPAEPNSKPPKKKKGARGKRSQLKEALSTGFVLLDRSSPDMALKTIINLFRNIEEEWTQ